MSLSSAARRVLGKNRTLTNSKRRGKIGYRTGLLFISSSRVLGGAASMEVNRDAMPRHYNLGPP